jgi:hypothetical protein
VVRRCSEAAEVPHLPWAVSEGRSLSELKIEREGTCGVRWRGSIWRKFGHKEYDVMTTDVEIVTELRINCTYISMIHFKPFSGHVAMSRVALICWAHGLKNQSKTSRFL